MAKRIAQKLVEKSIKDIEPKIQKIEAIEKVVEKNQDEAHYEEIGKTHKDWKTIRDSGNLTKWIEAQPKIVRTSFERVVKQGTADEVVEMFDLYKESNGIKEESKPVEKREQIPKKKVEDLLAVESGASGNPKGKGKIGMDDFNASWEEALRQP
jgi:galactose-1-phosphate uridylyltransferase